MTAPNERAVSGGEIPVGQRIGNFFGGMARQRARRNRRTMLKLVRNTWVEGVLEQSLHDAAMIALGLEERANAAERPWGMVLQVPGQSSRPLPPDAKIVDVFDETGRALLILGGPGSGKTTALLELAGDAIARAEEDPTQPIPAVFPLSSWAEQRQPIAAWLVGELTAKYHVPKRIAQSWVENDDLLLLLDGLDEVEAEHREACVQAIGDFRQEHGLVPLVICSRVANYEVLIIRLDLRGAVLLQPLTPQQIDAYLDSAGGELVAVREALQHDAVLQELVQTPLMLDVMALAYRGVSVEDLPLDGTAEARRRHVFDRYVQRTFEEEQADQPYRREQVIHWLAWLARQMTAHAQTVFLIEGLQPDWLPTGVQRTQRWVRRAVRLVVGLALWLVFGLATGLPYGLGVGRDVVGAEASEIRYLPTAGFFGRAFSPAAGPEVGLVVGLVVGLAIGLFYGLLGLVLGLIFKLDSVEAVEALRWSWREGLKRLSVGLGVGLGVGLIVGLTFGLAFGLGWGLTPVLVFVQVWGSDAGLIWGLLFGLFFGLLFGLVYGLFGLGGGLVVGPTVGLVGGLAVVLVDGLSYAGIKTKTVSNQGIRRSAKNALIGGSFVGLIVGLVVGLTSWLADSWQVLLVLLVVGLTSELVLELVLGFALWLAGFGLVWGLISGLVAGLYFYGGRSVILHLVLRYFLRRSGCAPWCYARFLDYAVECAFLRRVGGGYIFVHRLVQDYFASLCEGAATGAHTTSSHAIGTASAGRATG